MKLEIILAGELQSGDTVLTGDSGIMIASGIETVESLPGEVLVDIGLSSGRHVFLHRGSHVVTID